MKNTRILVKELETFAADMTSLTEDKAIPEPGRKAVGRLNARLRATLESFYELLFETDVEGSKSALRLVPPHLLRKYASLYFEGQASDWVRLKLAQFLIDLAIDRGVEPLQLWHELIVSNGSLNKSEA